MDWKSGLRSFLATARKLTLDDIKDLTNLARDINETLHRFLPLAPEAIPQMSYSEAIAYFVNQRPADSRVSKGAILLQDHRQGKMLTQVFLDTNQELVCDSSGKPYGRRLIARRLDTELAAAFGDQNLIIVE